MKAKAKARRVTIGSKPVEESVERSPTPSSKTNFDFDRAVAALGAISVRVAGLAAAEPGAADDQRAAGDSEAATGQPTVNPLLPVALPPVAAGTSPARATNAGQLLRTASLPATDAPARSPTPDGAEASEASPVADSPPAVGEIDWRRMDEIAWRHVLRPSTEAPTAASDTQPAMHDGAPPEAGCATDAAPSALVPPLAEPSPLPEPAPVLNGKSVEVALAESTEADPPRSDIAAPADDPAIIESSLPVEPGDGIVVASFDRSAGAGQPASPEPTSEIEASAASIVPDETELDWPAHRDAQPVPSAAEPLAAVASPLPSPGHLSEVGPPQRPRLSLFAGILIGAAAGAGVAVAAMLVLSPLLGPSVDQRVTPVADRVFRVEARMEQMNRVIGQLSNEMAQSIDSGLGISKRIAAEDAALAEIQHRLDQSAGATAQANVDPSILAVAVAQLRAAFYSGRPFESEIINVYTITRGDDHLVVLLQGLTASARSGVPTVAQMREQFHAYAGAAGLRIGAPRGWYDYATSVLDQYTGYSGQPIEAGNAAVTEADRRLGDGDVASAIAIVASIDPSVAGPMQPWLDAARLYVREEAAIAELTKSVIATLRARMRNAGAG